jgi:hypothetical protein
LIGVLMGTAAAMLAGVALRAETTRLHFELSRIDVRAEAILQRLREQELELARLRNPETIRSRVADLLAREHAEARGRRRGTP